MLELIAENLPILLCGVIGVGLLVVEAFMPGFGLPGISGIILQVVSVALTWVEHGPVAALGATLIVLSVDAIAISLALHSATKGKLSKSKLILRDYVGFRYHHHFCRLGGGDRPGGIPAVLPHWLVD